MGGASAVRAGRDETSRELWRHSKRRRSRRTADSVRKEQGPLNCLANPGRQRKLMKRGRKGASAPLRRKVLVRELGPLDGPQSLQMESIVCYDWSEISSSDAPKSIIYAW